MDASLGEKIKKLGIEGIGTVTEPKRVYPQGYLASQVLGLVGTDNVGLSGLEYARDKDLHGEDGERQLVKDALGEPVSLVETKRAKPGENLQLTLDARIQERTEAVLAEVGQTYTPQGATAVVMDPRSGEILALANWPRVDANNVGGAPAFARTEPRDPGELRARLDLQGDHGLGRALRGARGARHHAVGAAEDPGGRPDGRRGPRRGRRDDGGARSSRSRRTSAR